jgi:site-specific DNA-cytosine methylase
MIVLSLFDGISGAQVALKNLGVRTDFYLASEINQKAIEVTQKNFPQTIQLGDITKLSVKKGEADLIVFGSPCTDLSIAKKNRESLQGKSSGLFYKAVEILNLLKPKHFLMENVASMSQESKDEISKILGVSPVEINSRDFTCQNRSRLYWCNWTIPQVPPTQCTGGFREKLLPISDDLRPLLLTQKGIAYMCNRVKGGRTHWDFGHHSDTDKPYSACIVSNFKKGVPYNVLIDRRMTPQHDNWKRRFHPIECERLQGFPDRYTEGVADTHRYEAIGNSFTVPVIEHILRPII